MLILGVFSSLPRPGRLATPEFGLAALGPRFSIKITKPKEANYLPAPQKNQQNDCRC
jgi:hypothetical protein